MTTGYRYAMQQWVSDGVRTSYNFSFDGGYLHSTDVKAYREPYNGFAVTGAREDLPVTFLVDNPADGQTATVRVGAVPTTPQPLGYRITVYRSTEKAVPLVDFQNGAVLTGGNLDTLAKQAMFGVAEIADEFNDVDDNLQVSLDDFASRIQQCETVSTEADLTATSALSAANAAQATANGAVTTANNATATANATAAQLGDAITAANNATTAANNATAALTGIEDDVNSAVDQANAAVVTANAASANADALSGQITTANDNATNALNTANAIDAKAQAALDNSVTATNTANSAQTAVNNLSTNVSTNYMPKAGGAFTGAVSLVGSTYGGVVATGPTDLSKHISLHSSGYGLSITTNSFNYVGANTSAVHNFYGGATLYLTVSNTLFQWKGNNIWTEANFDPTAKANLASPTFSGGIGVFTAPAGFGLLIGDGGVGNGRFVKISNPGTGASTGYVGFQTDSNGTTGALQTFCSAYTGIALLANKTELSNSDGGLVYSCVSTTGLHTWTCGTGRTTRMTLSNAGVLNVPTGSVTASGGFQSTSSRKVKTKMSPIRNALKTVDALELVVGQYKRDFIADGRRHYFAIAEQAEMHAPPLVVQDIGEYRGESIPGFDYDGLAVLNSAAIQELLRIVQAQQEQINELREML